MLLEKYSEKRIKRLFVLIVLNSVFTISWGQENSASTFYSLNIRIYPDSNRIECKTEIHNPGDSIFLLTNSLKINSVEANGKNVKFSRKATPDKSYEIAVHTNSPGKIVFEYSGQIYPDSFPKTINTLNMIRSGLVELSDFIDWYPRMKNHSQFKYELNLTIPSSNVTIVNGILREQVIGKEYVREKWEAQKPVYGITLVAAPGIKKSNLTKNGNTIEIYYTNLPVSYIDSMKNNLLKSMELLTELYGAPGAERLVRVVYSPRSAGAYARAPMILVSENYALEQRNLRFGHARDFHLNSHEMAHYWSRANAGTTDDWINEGLAEYSAFLMSEKIIGKDFSDVLLGEYRDIVSSSRTETSIFETPGDSRDREVNIYFKPTLLLFELSQKSGGEKMTGFINALYAGFTQKGEATTSLFLEEVGNSFGNEEKESFSDAIYKNNWHNAEMLPEVIYSITDTAFLGKWTGPLTQFGSTTSFVLNLNQVNGNLAASVDSPDQNVTGIPVSDLIITAGSISFKIGVASASFKGHLDSNNLLIDAIFTQRGADYPLKLTKE